MRILVTDRNFVGEPALERAAAGPGIDLTVFESAASVPDSAWREADGIITYRGTAQVMAAMPLLECCRVIVRGGVGYDGLDLAGLGARGIAVCTVPDYGTTEVADHAIGLMLALRRGIGWYHDRLRADAAGNWGWAGPPCLDRLRGRTVGIVGLGRIGLAAARRAAAFDMQVQFYDPHLPDGADLATGYRRLRSPEALFETSDVVSIHTPLTDDTRGFVNADRLRRMPEGAVLINTARGPIVDLDALEAGLREGRPAGAALDVLPVEPPKQPHPLIRAYMDREPWLEGRLILTPHAAFYSPPGHEDLRRKAIETAALFLREGQLRNCVNAALLQR